MFSIILSIICVYILNVVIYNNYLDLILKHLPFVDPKFSDETPEEESAYLKTNEQIAAEIFFIFNEVKKN
jgi:hypothetical protein